MKTLEIVLFAVTTVSVICSENVDKRSSNNEQVLLNQGEYYSRGDAPNDKPKGYEDQFGYKVNTKKHYPPEPKENVQYMIIKRTHDGPVPKKYVMAHSSAEMTSYHNKQPSKIAYSVAHKPKVMPVKVVQEGSVKHIYLDMPDLFDDVPPTPKGKPSKVPQTYENVNQAASNINYHYNGYNPGQHEQQNYYRPSVQYSSVPANIKSAPSHQQGYNTISSGYTIGKTNSLSQGHGQQFAGEYSSGFGSNVHPQEAQYGSQDFGNSGYSSAQNPQFVPSYQNGYAQSQFPQFSEDGKERYMYEIPDQYKSLFSNNDHAYAASQSQGFSASVAQNQPTYDFGKGQSQQNYEFGKAQNSQAYDFGNTQDQRTYDFGKTQKQQTYDFGKSQNQETYDFGGKTQKQPTYDFGGKKQKQQSYNFGKNQNPQNYEFGETQNQQTYDFGGKPQIQQTFDFGKTQNQQTFDFGSAQNNPSYDFGKTQEQQTYEFGKTARMGKISGFDPNLVNIVNDALNNGQGQTTSNGFRINKSNDDKSVYLIGKSGMPSDTVPNLASYSFKVSSEVPEQPQSQTSSKIKYV